MDRRLGDLYKVPDGWYIVGAGNRIEDSAVATSMSSALANRFLHVELTENSEMWVKWGISHNIVPDVLGFIRFRPDLLFKMDGENLERGWPSPRSWERVSIMEQTMGGSLLFSKIVQGLVGNAAGVEFLAYRDIASEYDNIFEVMLNEKSSFKFPEKADRAYAVCTALVYHLWKGVDKDDEEKRLNGFFRLIMDMPSSYATMCMMDALYDSNDPKNGIPTSGHAEKLYRHKMFNDWRKKFGNAMTKRMSRK